jgi:hypothetical protein
MCFSLEASFISGSVLAVVGVAAIKKTHTIPQAMFAGFPLLFSFQQFSEGFVWLSITNTEYSSWLKPSATIFLTIAEVIWPTWISLSLLLLEKQKINKIILSFLFGIGVIVSTYLGLNLLTNTIKVEETNYHIYYNFGVPDTIIQVFSILYFLAAVLPLFISSINIKKTLPIGLLIFLSYLVSKIYFENYVLSVWCFFAALISVLVYSITFDFQTSKE